MSLKVVGLEVGLAVQLSVDYTRHPRMRSRGPGAAGDQSW